MINEKSTLLRGNRPTRSSSRLDDSQSIRLGDGGTEPYKARWGKSRRLLKFFENERVRKVLDYTQMILSILFAFVYVWQTFLPPGSPPDALSYVREILTVSCTAFFLVDHYRSWTMATSAGSYIKAWSTWVDYLTIIPVIIQFIRTQHFIIWDDPLPWRLPLPMRFARVQHRLNRIIRRKDLGVNVVTRQILATTNVVLAILFAGAGYLQIVVMDIQNVGIANLPDDYIPIDTSFENMVFNMVIMMLTINYPDNNTTSEHMVVLLFILVLFLGAGPQISTLIDLVGSQSRFRHPYKRAGKSVGHVVLAGQVYEEDFLVGFLGEFFHEDRGTSRDQVVVLSPVEPDEDLVELLEDPKFRSRVRYVKGSLLDDDDLKKVRIKDARALFILTGSSSTTMEEGEIAKNRLDATNIMKVMAVNGMETDRDFRIIMQVLRQENKEIALKTGADHVVCIDQMRMSLMAKNCLCAGFSTLICNLTRSSGDEVGKEEGSFADEYGHGIGFELYETKIPDALAKMTFAEAARKIYDLFDSVLVALVVNMRDNQTYSALNPGKHYILRGGELAFVIASERDVATQISMSSLYDIASKKSQELTDFSSWSLPSNGPVYKGLTRSRSTFDETRSVSAAVVSTIYDHIVVLSIRPLDSGFSHFLEPLRGAHIPQRDHKKIVVLCPDVPSEDLFSSLFGRYDDVHFVQGNPLEAAALGSVRVHTAASVVIFSSTTKSSEAEDEAVVDADGLYLSLLVGNLQNAVEMQPDEDVYDTLQAGRRSSVFDRPDGRRGSPRPVALTTPLQASRSVNTLEVNYATSMMLLQRRDAEGDMPFKTSSYAGGSVFCAEMLDMVLCQVFHSRNFLGVLDEIVFGGGHSFTANGQNIRQAIVQLLPIPGEFLEQTYESLFHHMLEKEDCILLGLYRHRAENDPERPWSFVYTCPRKATRILQGDRMYCLIRPRSM